MSLALIPVLMLACLWLLMRGYHGLSGDGQIYAFQAFARIHTELAADLYLKNTSQDQFTIFSSLYALCIRAFGLDDAARLLTVVFSVWLAAASWSVARIVAGRDVAWLAVAFLTIVAGNYGGSGVFRISESFLTARLPAEALVVTALACHLHGRKRLGLVLAGVALLVHPLIALPGLLLLICLRLPTRLAIMAAIGGTLATVAGAAAVIATVIPGSDHGPLAVMDLAWLEVVRERSQFLFLPLWTAHDWDVNAQPFFYLAFTAIVLPERRIRDLCGGAALVGAAGLAVAFIGSAWGPIAILIQGQAWRWLWVAVFVSALLLPATALQVWRDAKCGPLCTLLLIAGLTVSILDGTACASLAWLLWLFRESITERLARYLRWTSVALGIAIMVWLAVKSWTIVSPAAPTGTAQFGAIQLREIFGLRFPAVLFVVLIWGWLSHLRRASPSLRSPLLICACLAGFCAFVWPSAFWQARAFGSAADNNAFAAWRNAIPPTSTVLVAPAHDVGAFVWFILGRPNYLALNQSAGVVFSRATALEVERRSQVLLPLMDPNWKIMTRLAKPTSVHHEPAARPLTAKILTQVCMDPALGFVVSKDEVGFDPLRQTEAGIWQDWNLYDCRKVRAASAT